MAFQTVPDTARVTVSYDRGGDWPVENVYYVRDTVLGWPQAALDNLVTAFKAWENTNCKPLRAQNLHLIKIHAVNLDVEFGLESETTYDEAGTAAGVECVAVLSAVVEWTCDGGAPPKRGRTFWGGLTEAQFVGDALDSTFLTALDAAFTALAGDLSGTVASWAQVMVSRYAGFTLVTRPNGTVVKQPTPRTPALTNTLANVGVRAVVGTQERRRR